MLIVAHTPVCTTVTLGIDTHRDTNMVAALDDHGTHLGTAEFATTAAGHARLWAWATAFGHVDRAGIEGSSSYGSGISRFLQRRTVRVIEVRQPNRQARRRHGKSDPLDALAAARAVHNAEADGTAKSTLGIIEAIRALRVARCSARNQRVAALAQMRALITTAPDDLRAQLEHTTIHDLVHTAMRLRPAAELSDPGAATKYALRSLARRVDALDAELADLDEHLDTLVTKAAPALVGAYGVGTDTAGALLVAAGDNPERLHSEAAFARLCGVAPIPASTGQTVRYRLSRGGNRQANQALWRITMVRLVRDKTTQDYYARRTTEGKTRREITRCLKRYIARELYPLLPDNVKQPLDER